MTYQCIQDILPLVDMPSQYIGSEVNAIKKDPKTVELFIALAFPDLYAIGTSHFGLQILYQLLNREKTIAAERVYAPDTDMESRLRSARLPLATLESARPLTQFDIIGFSLLYELNYTNVLTILDLAGIPFFARDRDLSFPLVIAGGPCTCNPEPVADFFDAMVIGDGENVILEMADCWRAWKHGGGSDKTLLLESWRHIEGVYVPSFFEPAYTAEGFQTLVPRYPDYLKVLRAIIPSLNDAPFPEKPVVPYGRPVHDRLRLEVSRGCTRGCRFCQAGMIYRPVRERSVHTLMQQAENALAATGYDELSLLSLSTSDYGCMPELMARLIARCAPEHIAVSLPSFRAGTLTPELMTQIKQIRKTGFTIAPEAGSQRLRNVINKNITREDIVSTVHDAFSLGWQVIKLYFMIGLPTETDEDLSAMVDLVLDLRKLKLQKTKGMKGHKNQINVSVNTFIPKPHTPFQWAPQLTVEESQKKIHWLKEKLHYSDVQFKWQHPRVGLLEGLWARGDRRLARLLVIAWQNGCRMDGWSDHFDASKWEKSLEESGIDIAFYTTRVRDLAEPLPWDHIHVRVTKAFLISEWEKALLQESTPDCRSGDCQSCGVCDFQAIEPRVFAASESQGSETRVDSAIPTFTDAIRYRISYAKTGPARVFGHLELANIMFRAFRRAKIPVAFSSGFHPKPKISFDDPLPVGMESLHETCVVSARPVFSARQMMDRLNQALPEGLAVTRWEIAPSKKEAVACESIRYRVQLKTGGFERSRIETFLESEAVIKNRINRKGIMTLVNYKEHVEHLELDEDDHLVLTIRSGKQQTVRPAEILTAVFDLSEDAIKTARIVKLAPD
ncbi:MAG: TIGR03960 family B12-binding radical SAM protein [Deltaproteobacteria bacterium]|nr:TIGR03960 family B12-binding radical SAM protein [Deltaproteobacteria bacterium]